MPDCPSCTFYAGFFSQPWSCPGVAPADESERLGRYSYEETKRLVSFVEDAAALIEQKGEFAFQDFNVPGSKWLTDDYYIFVYTPDGTNVFHPVETSSSDVFSSICVT